ncbi:MAG: hypothetical protein JWQ98_841 [Chlorobi bacterium]|nr:hypothetical protein [Chlorobiota bacterium]
MNRRLPLKIGKVLLIVVVAATVLGFIVMNLWNALIPELFHGPTITFWQGIGLLLLSHILFRGIGPRGGPRGGFSDRWRRNRWKGTMRDRMASMSPEEREKFKEKWGERRRKFEARMASMSPEERERFREKWGEGCGPFGDDPMDIGDEKMNT